MDNLSFNLNAAYHKLVRSSELGVRSVQFVV
jgi:hypothetical protein